MFTFRSTKEQLLEERRKNTKLQVDIAKATADIEYIAMMTDVDIEEEAETND